MDIWPHFKNLTHRDMFVFQHGLAGYFFAHEREAKISSYESFYLQTDLLNQIYQAELIQITQEAQKLGIQCLPIKGMHLLGMIYSDFGQRKMSDIDILSNDLNALKELLMNHSYKIADEGEYKVSLTKFIDGNEVVFEIHSRLYSDSTIKPHFEGDNLTLQEHFYFLVYHLSYQHTFLRLNWFVDIALFIKKYPEVLNGILDLAKKRGHLRAFKITFFFLHDFFDIKFETKEKRTLKMFDFSFLLNPQSYKLKYYFLKHLTKESLWDAVLYDLNWLLKKIGKNFHRLTA